MRNEASSQPHFLSRRMCREVKRKPKEVSWIRKVPASSPVWRDSTVLGIAQRLYIIPAVAGWTLVSEIRAHRQLTISESWALFTVIID